MSRSLVIVDTQTSNLASLLAAFERLGWESTVTAEAQVVDEARVLVLPGVGSFGAGMQRLRECELIEPLRRRLAEEKPTLCICLGLQLLCTASEESPGVEGLGVIAAAVKRFAAELITPHMGWNRVTPLEEGAKDALLSTGAAYFANSYRIVDPPAGWRCASTDYGGPFVSALERGPILACQFHPELSSAWGADLLRRWLARAEAAASERGAVSCR